MNIKKKTLKKLTLQLMLVSILVLVGFILFNAQGLIFANAEETDYTFETVPLENITLTVDDGLSEIQPRQSFTISYILNPWYTTTTKVYFDVFPQNAAIVKEIVSVAVNGGQKVGKAEVTISADAVVGDTITVVASADNVESNDITVTVSKIPVTGLKLSLVGNDDKLHIGKTRHITHEFLPSFATIQDVGYELSGSGMQYIESFDEESGTILAKSNILSLDVNSTVMITAYSIDDPSIRDSVTVSLFIPTTVVELSASTPLGGRNNDNLPLAVASSVQGETVSLHTKINGIESAGLNYVIVSGQEYVVNGLVRADGTFSLKATTNWTSAMRVPHAEIKIKVAYSDGFDEIVISIYVPIESIAFKNSAPTNVENYREYDLEAEAFPKYATYLADNDDPISYTLNGLSNTIASVDSRGLLTLPKSLTSKNKVINYAAYLPRAWESVDAAPLTHSLSIIPVYATDFKSILITKNGTSIESSSVKVSPTDILSVEASYTIDNVTDTAFSLSENSDMVSTSESSVMIAGLSSMRADNPYVNITVSYNNGGRSFSVNRSISIYVPAESAIISDATFNRDEVLNLNSFLTINGHGYASNKTITWGTPTVSNGKIGIMASCNNGQLKINSQANAGTKVIIQYKTSDSETWQYKEFTVAPLSGVFDLSYGMSNNANDNRQYTIDLNAPQLEEGQGVDLLLKFRKNGIISNAVGGSNNFGLSYSISQVSNNATLTIGSCYNGYDSFRLRANVGESGRNNSISYLITIKDGTSTYYVRTEDKSASDTLECVTKPVAIFNRISGEVDVSNLTIGEGGTFILKGWDNVATFNADNLVWSIGGTKLTNRTLPSGLDQFILKISATQKYNGQDIAWSEEISFSKIVYKNSDIVLKTVYKKIGATMTIEGAFYKYGYIQSGWSTSSGGSKSSTYTFGYKYSGSSDLTLWGYYIKVSEEMKIEEEKTLDENQNANQHTSEYDLYLNLTELKDLGYKTINIYMEIVLERTNNSGNFADLWLDVNGSQVFAKNDFEPSTSKMIYRYSADVDISAFTDSSKIRYGFYTDDDGVWGKFTWKFYQSNITFTVIK